MYEELTHYGVLGMKWGKRKSQRSNSEDHTNAASLRKKKISELSNKELKALNERLQLERQYSDLNPLTIGSGKKLAGELLKNTAKQTASTYMSKGLAKAIEAALKKK